MTIQVNNIVQVRLEGIITPSATRWQNVFHLQCNDSVDGPDYTVLGELNDYVETRWEATLQGVQSDQCSLQVIRSQIIAPGRSIFSAKAVDIAGGAAGAIGQPDAAIVCTLRTDKPGKSFTGRFYLGGIADALEEQGRVAAASYDAVCTEFAEFFLEPWAVGSGVLVTTVWSETVWQATTSLGDASTVVQRVDIDRIIRRQVRRDWKGRQGTIVTSP